MRISCRAGTLFSRGSTSSSRELSSPPRRPLRRVPRRARHSRDMAWEETPQPRTPRSAAPHPISTLDGGVPMKSIAAAALIASTFAFSAFCQEDTPLSDVVNKNQSWAGWSFQEENDVLTKTNTDKYYTQGLRFSITRNPHKNPQQIKDFSHWFLVHFNNGLNAAPPIWTIGLGQNIYTPDDITISTPQLNDRHWGGFLYIDNQLQIVAKNESVRHLFEAQTGVVGSYSAARWAQTTLHKLIGSAKPQGWSN